MPRRRKSWLKVSLVEWYASASMDADPVMNAAAYLKSAMPKLPKSAAITVRLVPFMWKKCFVGGIYSCRGTTVESYSPQLIFQLDAVD